MSGLGLAGFRGVRLDASDVGLVAEFWATVLGHDVQVHDGGSAELSGGDGPDLRVVPAADSQAGEGRVHADVQLHGDDPAALLALGATVVRGATADERWWVLADPEGNEFCAYLPETLASNDEDAEVPV